MPNVDDVLEYDEDWTFEQRVENHGVLAEEVVRLQKVVADQALTIGVLKDSNAAQACVIRDYGLENAKLQTLLVETQDRAQTSSLALDVALKALKWFEERDRFLNEAFLRREVLGSSELVAWERENPKPGVERRCAHCDGPESEHTPDGHAFVPPGAAT